MKKIIAITTILMSIFLTGCLGNEPVNELNEEQKALEINQRDQARKDRLITLTYALGKYYRDHEKYPEASENWCADDLIELMIKEEHLTTGFKDADTQNIEDLSCEESGIYYFFREDNPDYYTFGIKLEGDYIGNTDLTPQEITKAPIEELRPIRRSSIEEDSEARGNYFYIIGNYPIELLQKQ